MKISIRHEGEIKILPDERKLKEFVDNRSAPNDILKEFLHI